MPMCTACSEIDRRTLDARKHDQLQPTETLCYRAVNRAITIERYRCRICGSRWEYTNDIKDLRAGWRTI